MNIFKGEFLQAVILSGGRDCFRIEKIPEILEKFYEISNASRDVKISKNFKKHRFKNVFTALDDCLKFTDKNLSKFLHKSTDAQKATILEISIRSFLMGLSLLQNDFFFLKMFKSGQLTFKICDRQKLLKISEKRPADFSSQHFKIALVLGLLNLVNFSNFELSDGPVIQYAIFLNLKFFENFHIEKFRADFLQNFPKNEKFLRKSFSAAGNWGENFQWPRNFQGQKDEKFQNFLNEFENLRIFVFGLFKIENEILRELTEKGVE